MSGNIVVSGTLTCAPEHLEAVTVGLREHVRLSRAEPGNISFSIEQSGDDRCVFEVNERFVDKAAFETHGERMRGSAWMEISQHVGRDLNITEE